MIIHRTEIFTSEEGQIIIGQMPVGEGSPKFQAEAQLNFMDGGRPLQFPFKFEIPGNSVEEAFANFPTAIASATEKAKVDLDQLKKQAKQEATRRKLLVGSAAGVPKIPQ
jgi:hypothetical protein